MQTETVQIGVSKQYCLFLLLYDKWQACVADACYKFLALPKATTATIKTTEKKKKITL